MIFTLSTNETFRINVIYMFIICVLILFVWSFRGIFIAPFIEFYVLFMSLLGINVIKKDKKEDKKKFNILIN